MHKDNQTKKSTPIQCVVISTKMMKSRVGKIDRLVKEPRVGKYLKKSSKIMFHDEQNTSQLGDSVLIMPCKPKSGSKRFELVKVVEKARV